MEGLGTIESYFHSSSGAPGPCSYVDCAAKNARVLDNLHLRFREFVCAPGCSYAPDIVDQRSHMLPQKNKHLQTVPST